VVYLEVLRFFRGNCGFGLWCGVLYPMTALGVLHIYLVAGHPLLLFGYRVWCYLGR